MSENNNEKFLEVKDLEVVYTQNRKIVHAVNGVSFSLEKGKTLALVGETGAGKTTIAKSILGILPVPPAEVRRGEILLNGEDLLKKPEKEMQKIRGDEIAMVFQDPMTALNPIQTVGDQIIEGLMLHNDYTRDQAVEKTKEMLELVGIPGERYQEYPFEFSGGMKQRVVIAMALACNPQLLLADEPTTALDVTIQAQVLSLINDLRKKLNTAMILITHDLGVVVQTSDDVAVVYAGQIVEYGTKYHIFAETLHPYTKGLFSSLPSMSVNSKRLQPIPGAMPNPTELPQGCYFSPRCPFATDKCRQGEIPLTEVTPGHFCRCIKDVKGV